MIKHLIITGDTHGRPIERIHKIADIYPNYLPEETAVVILGDAGINYFLTGFDYKQKKMVINLKRLKEVSDYEN